MALNVRREAARSLFERLEEELLGDEVLADKHCVRMIIEKAEADHKTGSRKRFDAEAVFRNKLLYDRVDDAVGDWCRRRQIRADPFSVFRYGGTERGPTQHETAIGPSLVQIDRFFGRLAEDVPELRDCRAALVRSPTRAPSPAFRFQHPLPFGAAGDCKYNASRKDLDRGVYQAALYVGTGGDVSRGWRYDCALLLQYCLDRPRKVFGEEFWEAWPEVRERIWKAGRVWVILL